MSRASAAMGRRAWLAGAAAFLLRRPTASPAADAGPDDDEDVVREFQTRARAARIGTLRAARSRDFLALGDADEGFLRLTLGDCEAVALDYLDHFRARGFGVAPPARRLTIAALADERSYAALLGKDVAEMSGAAYIRSANFLVLYDYRRAPPRASRAGYLNLKSLAHEATHQLTFNTGVLNRAGDVPKCVIEGFGTYGEVRRRTGRTEPGQLNAPRLEDFAHARRSQPWIALPRLLTDDALARSDDERRRQLFYAQSWLFVYHHMKEPGRLAAFRAYLAAIRDRTSPSSRLDDARAHLGDLDRLDAALRDHATRLVRALP